MFGGGGGTRTLLIGVVLGVAGISLLDGLVQLRNHPFTDSASLKDQQPHHNISNVSIAIGRNASLDVNDKPHSRIQDPSRNCVENPYLPSLENIDVIVHRMKDWLYREVAIEKRLVALTQGDYTHKRFDAFEEMSSCKKDCVGGRCNDDEAKNICGLSKLNKPNRNIANITNKSNEPCVIYSVGGNNWWSFENGLLSKTTCEIHTFDCTGPRSRFTPPINDRLHFHFLCLGTTNQPAPVYGTNVTPRESDMVGEMWTLEKIQSTLQHDRIDLFKMDIEGYEWPLFNSWPDLFDIRSPGTVLPMQILVEIHYRTHMPELSVQNKTPKRIYKHAQDMVRLQSHLLKAGYITVFNDPNPACRHCTELTLVRVQCPQISTKGDVDLIGRANALPENLLEEEQEMLSSPTTKPVKTTMTTTTMPIPEVMVPNLDSPTPSMSKLNVSEATIAFHVGWDSSYGQTNNQLIAIWQALDMAFDKHGEIGADGSNCTVVVAVSGWALQTLKGFFFDETSATEWAVKLERTVPIVHLSRTQGKKIVAITAQDAFYYTKRNLMMVHSDSIQRRRKMILGQLFRTNVRKSAMEKYVLLGHRLVEMATENNNQLKNMYMAIHSRHLEGQCERRLGNKLPNDECDMNPTYIKNILRQNGLLGRIAVVVISDMQQQESLRALRNDPEIGHLVIIPALDFNRSVASSSVASDMMIAAMSDIFVGTRVSSMSVVIGLIRAVIGKDLQTNYVYEYRNDHDVLLAVCEDCIYFCNATSAHGDVCGNTSVYA